MSEHLSAFWQTARHSATPSRRPWAPRLDLWYQAHARTDSLPKRYRGDSLREIENALGCIPHRRDARVVEAVYDGVEVARQDDGVTISVDYSTPIGSVSEEYQWPTDPLARAAGYPPLMTKHRIAGLADYPIARYVEDHTFYTPAYEAIREHSQALDGEGFVVTNLGYDPMYTVLNDYIGFGQAYYELADHRADVLGLYEAIWQRNLRLLAAAADAPVELMLHGAHFDGAMTPPPIFDEFMVPYYQSIKSWFDSHGKLLVFHADADASGLLGSFAECGIAMVDCLCTSPMGQVTMEQAFDVWGDRIAVWGGIPSVLLHPESCADGEFDDYLSYLRRICNDYPEGRLILGVSDNVMPGADMSRLERISILSESLPVAGASR